MRFEFHGVGIVAVLWAAALSAALPAKASDYQPLTPAFLAQDEAPNYVFSLGLGGGQYAGDGVVQIRPGIHIRLQDTHLGKDGRVFGMDSTAPLAIDIVAPLHLTVADHGLHDGAWRKTEYDQYSEFFSVLRRVEYGSVNGPMYMRIGALSDVRFGHGTILEHYQSNYRFDARQWGLLLTLQSPVAGGTFFLDDILDPSLVGARIFVAPWARQAGAARALSLAISMVGDFSAPSTLRGGEHTPMSFDDKRQVRVDDREGVSMLGFEFEAQAVDTQRTRMTIYSDVNLLFPRTSVGWHTGASLGWQSGKKSVFGLQGEFILHNAGYLPGYFDRAYAISRVRIAAPWTTPQPLAAFRKQRRLEAGTETGYRVQIQWQHSQIGNLKIGVRGGSARFDEALFAQYASPEDYRVRIAVRYELPWVQSWQRVHLFDQAALAAQIQVSITPWMSAWATAQRRWRQTVHNDLKPQTALQAGMTFYSALTR